MNTKKIGLLLVAISLFFVYCDHKPENNGEAPGISDIRFNIDTKISYLKDTINNVYDTIIVNSKGNKEHKLDTLTLNLPVTINGHLTSVNGLTNMKVMIYGDTRPEANTDSTTCINISEVPKTYFFGENDTIISNLSVINTLPEKETTTSDGKEKIKFIRQGDEYKFNVYCIDRLGNLNDYSYHEKPIVILSSDSIIKLRRRK